MNSKETQIKVDHSVSGEDRKKVDYYIGLKYPIEIVEEEDGVVATIPDLPGCASFGDTIGEAVQNVNVTKELWIKGRIESGQAVPEPSNLDEFSGKFVLRIPRVLHKSLDREARRQGVSLNQYILHLLSERNAVTVMQLGVGQTIPYLKMSVGSHDSWEQVVYNYLFSVGSRNAQPVESLLANIDFVPKPPKDFKKLVTARQIRAEYQS